MATHFHTAVVTASIRGALETRQVRTVSPSEGEVRVRVEWTGKSIEKNNPITNAFQAFPFKNDGGLLVTHPQILGDGTAGTIVETGPGVKKLKVGDKVFGFTWRDAREKSHQEYVTTPEYLLGLIPSNSTPQEAITLGNNFVTVFHAITADLDIALPWPVPETKPDRANDKILIWGGSSSVGQYAIQVLKHWGYQDILTTSSPNHHSLLKSYGAKAVFDYRDADIVDRISKVDGDHLNLVLDCIGSKEGSLTPISRIVKKGAKVAVLLPVIVRDSSEEVTPIYGMNAEEEADWEEGVIVRGVRTHFYLENEFFKENLQSVIMPALLEQGFVKPNKIKIVEGGTLLERAQKAMNALRGKQQSGERLVWRVADEN